MKKMRTLSLFCVGLSLSSVTWADNFPAAGVDQTPSLGQFAIRLTKKMGENFGINGCPGDWNNPFDDCVIWSPVLYDGNTMIGRSDPHSEGDNTDDIDGAKICEDGTSNPCSTFSPELVKDDDLKPFPGNGFTEGPSGTQEVHTQILSLDMADSISKCGSSANAVRAGNAMTVVPSGKRKRSLGEVESLNSGSGDFPAESFFNMFVEVDLDWDLDGNKDMTLYNPSVPLTVQNSSLLGFPPEVVYVHGGGDGAAPVYDVATDKMVGWIVLAGHGVGTGQGESCEGRKAFGKALHDRAYEILIRVPSAVAMVSFQTQVYHGTVILNWATGIETNNAAFRIWQGELLPGKTECTLNIGDYVPQSIQMLSLVNSKGTEVSGAEYTTSIGNVPPGTYCYAVEDIEYGGASNFHFPNNNQPVVIQ